MAHIQELGARDVIIGKPFDKVDAILVKNGLARVGPFKAQYDSLREAGKPYHWVDARVPTVNLRGEPISRPYGDVVYGLPTDRPNIGKDADYKHFIAYPASQATITYWPSNAIQTSDFYFHLRYDIKTRAVLDIWEYNDSADTWFSSKMPTEAFMVIGAIASVATGGASAEFVALGQAGDAAVNGASLSSTLSAVANAESGKGAVNSAPADAVSAVSNTAASVAVNSGGSNVADFGLDGLEDYSPSSFDSFNFSDGEAFTAVSDAQNVDYGFGAQLDESLVTPAESMDIGAYVSDTPDNAMYDFGATPEPSTGFGTTAADSQFTPDSSLIKAGVKGIPVAVKAAEGASKTTSTTTATGGGTKNSQSTTSTTGSTKPTTQAGASATIATGPGVLSQIESMLSNTYTGQLKPNTGSSAVGKTNTMPTYLIIGAALLAAYVIVHKGK